MPGDPPRLAAAELREVVLPLRARFRSAASELAERRLLLLRLAAGGVEGWGECSLVPGYGTTSLAGARRHLRAGLAALVGAPVHDPGLLVARLPRGTPPEACFAVEAAGLDLLGRLRSTPARRLIGGFDLPVAVGAVVGAGDESALVAAAAAAAAAGYRRVKLKAASIDDLATVRSVRRALPEIALALDANGSFSPEHVPDLAACDDLGLAFLEQPFPAPDLDTSARLARRAATPVCLDEAVTGPDAARRVLASGAGSVLVLKPGRLGGTAAAREILDAARTAGAGAWVGGMLESGIGRAAALVLASLEGTTHPADLAPPGCYLAADVVTDFPVLEEGTLTPPAGPGLGITVDQAAVERWSVAVESAGSPF
jgi:O-succinylbenzoate synthase